MILNSPKKFSKSLIREYKQGKFIVYSGGRSAGKSWLQEMLLKHALESPTETIEWNCKGFLGYKSLRK